ncbi:Cro/Cl family transcriptional regulator [Streptococcus agalactiae]|uniref:helix-turn-helix domain-containing protein n=1 Tax=Streptococcus agalactiae TaxID=1311 RepID=UPI0006402429|nr:helix-turn-helix transcriptional regulator [Streptococcus agalactiae]KLJ82612.1 Cro/Cl family transcriptional regulator [Streptococcus agalactiae]
MFQERLKNLRLEKNLTQKQVAQRLNISQQAYGQWETGKLNPKKETIQMFANFFNVSIDYLLGNTDNKNEEMQILLRGTLEGLTDEEKKQFEIEFKEFLKERDKLFKE